MCSLFIGSYEISSVVVNGTVFPRPPLPSYECQGERLVHHLLSKKNQLNQFSAIKILNAKTANSRGVVEIAASPENDCILAHVRLLVVPCTTLFRTCFRKSNFLTSNFYGTCNGAHCTHEPNHHHVTLLLCIKPTYTFLTLCNFYFLVTFGLCRRADVISCGGNWFWHIAALHKLLSRPLQPSTASLSRTTGTMYQRLVHITNKYKILRGMISYAILWPVGNLIEQRLVEKKTFETFDWNKCLKCVPLNWVFAKPP